MMSMLMHAVRSEKSDYQFGGVRQTLQCVGQIKIGSSVQVLYQTPNFRRHGKHSGATPALSSSPTSKSQSSGASWMGNHDISHLEGARNQCGHSSLKTTDLSERIPPL
jgi:hypothetical protein